MRYNVKSVVNNEIKFDVIDTDSKDRKSIMSRLKKKYPDSEIAVIRVSQAMSAKSETL